MKKHFSLAHLNTNKSENEKWKIVPEIKQKKSENCGNAEIELKTDFKHFHSIQSLSFSSHFSFS